MTTESLPTTKLDSVQVEVIASALASICDEMGEALIKASYSPNIKERRDCTTCIFDAEGNALAQAEHIPVHLGSLMGIIGAVLNNYDLSDIRDGDTFVGNDPHTGGGTHLPDIVLVTPVFIDGDLRGWATNLAHHSDYADRGHAHIFQEGLRIPAVRFMRDWEFVPEVLQILLTNFQVPSERIADFNAQVASNRLGVARLREVYARYGTDTMIEASEALLDYTERKVRAGIAEIPNGRYEFADVFDCNEIDEVLNLSVVMIVKDDSLEFTFDAPPQVRAGVNMVRTALLATVFYAVKTVVGPDVPANAGLYRAIDVQAPAGSILNCLPPAAVNGRTQTCQRVVDLVLGAFSQAVPERVIAACNGAVTSVTFSGIDPRTDKFYVYLETVGGGLGAGACADGLDGVQAHVTNTSNLPVESLESEYPLTIERYELIDNSGGLGKHRGGMGIMRSVRVDHDDCVCDARIGRTESQPWGLEGGMPAVGSHLEINGHRGDQSNSIRVGAGETVAVYTAGGGGYGDPLERPLTSLVSDVREGRISQSVVEELYGEPFLRLAARAGDEAANGTG